ncbi:MAG TPA: MFS transporter [Candidatus Binatia bacterium]
MLNRIFRGFYGWRMVAVGSALRILGGGLYFYGFSVFFLPLSQDLGLSRAATALVFSLARAQGAFEGPVAGYIMDRYGPRPLIMMAIIMNGVGHMILSHVHSYLTLIIVYMGVVSLSFQAGFMDAPMVIANTWFVRLRTMAMSIISASVNVGGFLLTPLLASAVFHWGWRPAAFANGLAFLILGLPIAILVRRSPESMGLRPDGDPVDAGVAHRGGDKQPTETNFTLREALRTSPFWYLTIGTAFRVVTLTAITVHYVPILVWKGLSETEAAFLLGVQAFLGVPISLSFGWLGDRFNKPRLMAVSILFAMLSMAILALSRQEWQIWMFMPLFSLVESTFPINWSVVGDFFGRANFAKIRGSMIFIQAWGAVIGPVIAGAIYDHTQSYAYLLWSLVVVLFVVACCYLMVVKPVQRLADSG